jgi:glycerol-3-phosphate acyltransferase PlsY
MGSLLKLALSALAASSQSSAFAAFSGRMAVAAVLGVAALLLAGAAWACACAAIWIALIPALGPVGAPLVVAAICLVFAGILALVAWLLIRRRRRARLGEGLQVDVLLEEAGRLINENKVGALLAAALVGILAGSSGRKR